MLKDPVLAPVLCNIFINNLGDGAECTLSKFLNDTKRGGVADMPVDYAAIQRDLNRLEKGAVRSLMEFNKEERWGMGRTAPCTGCWVLPSWKAALQKRTWGSWWTPGLI